MTLDIMLKMLERLKEVYPDLMKYELTNFLNFHVDNVNKTVEIKINQ